MVQADKRDNIESTHRTWDQLMLEIHYSLTISILAHNANSLPSPDGSFMNSRASSSRRRCNSTTSDVFVSKLARSECYCVHQIGDWPVPIVHQISIAFA